MDPTTAGQRLLARLVEMEGEEHIGEADRAPVVLDQESVGRLSRIDEAEFGYCTGCGEAIAEARLIVDPSLPTCIACAERC